MANKIKIYSDLKSGKVFFDGSTVRSKDIGSLDAELHPSISNRIIIKSNNLFKRGSDTEYRVFFGKLNINRIQNEAGETLVDAPYNYDRDQILAYIQEQINTPIVTEYFQYDPTSDRLVAQKDIQVNKSGFFLGGKHKMASGNSNIYFEDLDNKANSYPVFGELLDQSLAANQVAGAGATKPKSRIFGDFQSVPLGGSPVNDTSIPYDGENFFPFNISGVGITTRIAEAVPASQQLKYEILVNGISVYVQFLEHNGLSVNEDLTWYFEHPLDVEAGTTIRATIYKVSIVGNVETIEGILNVCEGDDAATRYQTNVLNRFFEDEEIALKSDVDALLSGSTYKGSYNGATSLPTLPTGTDVLGDFYRVTAAGGGYNTGDILVFNGTDYDHIAEANATQSDIKNSGLKVYDIYVKAGYAGAVQDGSVLYPYADLTTAIGSTNDGDSIYVEGSFEIASQIALPTDKSLFFYGSDDAKISFTTYSDSNGSLLFFNGVDSTKELKFKNIEFHNAGGYGLYTKKTAKVTIEDCTFKNNGWNGTALNTVLPSTTTALLGYDSSAADLQAFYAGANASNGGAMRIEESTQLLIVGNTVTNNLRGIRVSDCGVGGAGVITRNQSTQNIESGIYLSVGALGGCQNVTVMMNVSSYNANNGLLVIGGINNKFSQNDVTGNWNAGFCAWGSANATLRDSSLYDNNRSQFNGIGNTGDAKASIQINDAYNLLGTQITYNPAFRFIAEILDTQVHYTGLGSNTEKIGFLITSAVGNLTDNAKNIIKVDDVGFIGQDYAIDLSEVDITNLRLSLGDNSYQSIGIKAVKAPLAGNYSELPFSNHVMEVPVLDVVVDTLKQTLSLKEGVGGNVINVYSMNELSSSIVGSTIQIIQASSDKIQLRGLTFGNIYINGVVAGNTLNSANDSLNAAFSMDLVDYKDFLVSEVGINGDSSGGGSLPAIANNWYISYGGQAGTQITQATIGNAYRNYNPFYNGEALEKGHEFIWTHNPSVGYIIGIWGAAEAAQSGTDALQPSNWTVGFAYASTNTRFSQSDSSGVAIEQSGSFAGYYGMPNGQLAIRFGQDNYLYLYEIVNGGYSLVGKSNSTVAGASVMIQWASFNQGSFPVMTERTESWEIVHDTDSSQNGEWSNGLEESTVIKSRISVSPGEKLTLNFDYFGRAEKIGFGYSGASTGVSGAEDTLDSGFFYNTSEVIKEMGASENNWTWNTSATNSYDPNGDRTDIGYDNSGNLGLISFRYNSDNSVEMWHETNNELIATKKVNLDGSAFNIYIGANENNHTADRIPALVKYDMSAEEEGASLTGWYYIESPDGEFYYPLFATEAEANYIDSVEGGSGTSHTHTYADDLYNGGSNTWYMPDTSGVHAGTSAPQGGIFGNSINVVWNEIPTGDDSNYLPTFNNITYNVQEGSAINIEYKPSGMTDTFNITNVPTGYADNGNAIIGTAEDITNGYGQAVTHTINVTKANNFGSVTGTITINVLANLAGNEFTIVEQSNGIRFTQDAGGTTLDFNTVTFNAGSTYKFYLDGPTVEANDTLMVVDANGNAYTTGVTLNGTPGSAGAYLEFAIPSDVPPVNLVWTDGDGAATVTVPMIVAGSTYTAAPTGINLEGPTANQSGSIIVPTNGYSKQGWLSLNETLDAGQRLILNNAFFTDLLSYANGNGGYADYEFAIGLKGDSWANTQKTTGSNFAASGIFKGDAYLSVRIFTSNQVRIKAYANGSASSEMLITAAQWGDACAFLDITSSGNNIRLGFGRNGDAGVTSGDESTVTYADWNSYKVQTGAQGYGITNLDVMFIAYNSWGATSEFDTAEIDWTELSEIAIPVAAASSTTPYSKAVNFGSSTSGWSKMVSTDSRWPTLRMNGTTGIVPANSFDAAKTSNSSVAYPWLTSVVFQPVASGPSDGGRIWSVGEGHQSSNYNITLMQQGSDIFFYWGYVAGSFIKFRVIENADPNKWYSVYIAHKGGRNSNASNTELGEWFDIRVMSSDDNFASVGSDLSTASEWGQSYNTDSGDISQNVNGTVYIGGVNGYSGNAFYGKVSSVVMHGLMRDVSLPDATEIKLIMTDPNKWETDYLIGNTQYRYGNGTHVYAKNNYSAALSTQIWLMGDGVNDSYSNGIRNQTHANEQNYSRMQLNNMQSSAIVNVTIPGLS